MSELQYLTDERMIKNICNIKIQIISLPIQMSRDNELRIKTRVLLQILN